MHKSGYHVRLLFTSLVSSNLSYNEQRYSEFSDIGNLFRIRLVSKILRSKRTERICCRVRLVQNV